MSIIVYRGYAAEVDFDSEKGCLAGKVTGIDQEIFFYGAGLSELKVEFHKAVDSYLLGQNQKEEKGGNKG